MKNILYLISLISLLITVSCMYTKYEKYIVEGEKTNVTIRYRGVNDDRKLEKNLKKIYVENLPVIIDIEPSAVYDGPYIYRNKSKLYWEIEAYSESPGTLILRMEESGVSNMTTNNYLRIVSYFEN